MRMLMLQSDAHLREQDLPLLAPQVQHRPRLPLKFLGVGLVFMLIIGYLSYTALSTSTVYYLTVSELDAKGNAAFNTPVRVGGRLVDGSLVRDPQGRLLRFTISDGSGNLPVAFKGDAPDLFGYAADGLYQDAVIEGKLDAQREFHASQIIVKHDANFQAADGSRPPMGTPSGSLPAKKG